MAAPLPPARLLQALRDEGVTVVEVGDWPQHNRNHMGLWGPVHGVMIHHTVTSGSDTTVRICHDGYEGLPGPLCHGVITKDGRVHLIGYGRTNHAGLGDDDVLRAVIAEHELPVDDEFTTDGNRHFYGFECENLGDGEDPWPGPQLEAIERVSAAICRLHGWGDRSVIGHLEWQPGKSDPAGFSMDWMRGRIAARLDQPAPPPAPKPVPPFPGREAFVIGRSHPSVTVLDRRLIALGFTRHHDGNGYQAGPVFTDHTRRNVRDFQLSRSELRWDADGYPGPLTWRLLHF